MLSRSGHTSFGAKWRGDGGRWQETKTPGPSSGVFSFDPWTENWEKVTSASHLTSFHTPAHARRTRRCYYADKMLTCGSGFSVRRNSFSSTVTSAETNVVRGARLGGGWRGWGVQTGGLVGWGEGGVIIWTKSPRNVSAWNRCCGAYDCASQTGICSRPPRSRCIFLTRIKRSAVCFFSVCVLRVSATLESRCQQIQGARDTSGTCSRQLGRCFLIKRGIKTGRRVMLWDYQMGLWFSGRYIKCNRYHF